ncbi:MAG: YncE family protein [Gemmatimonadales bacterium]
MHPVRSLAAALVLTLGAAQPAAGPTGTLVVTNMRDHTATILDLASGRTLATLATGEAPHEAAVSHDGRWAVVTNYGVRERPGHTLSVVDLRQPAVVRTIDVAPYQRPHGVAFLPGDRTLLVTSEGAQQVLEVDFASGRIVDSLGTRGRATHMLAVSADGHRIVTANIVDGTITSFRRPGGPAAVIPVARFVEGITVSPDGRTAWVGSNGDSVVVAVDLERGTPIDTLRGFGMPYRLGWTRDGRTVVIADPVRGEIRIVDAATRKNRSVIVVPREGVVETAEVPGSPSPEGVALSADGRFAFVTLQGRNQVATIDLGSGAIVGVLPTGVWSDGVAWSPLTR